MKADAEVGGPSSQGSTEPWDTTFNRATNAYKGRPLSMPPTSAGRVSGFGTSMKFINYYHSNAETKKDRRRPSKDKAEVVELRKKVETLENQKVDSTTVERLVDEKLKSFLPPGLMEGLAAWNAAGRQGPIYVPSVSGSNSTMNQNVSPDLTTPQPNATTPPTAKDSEPQPVAAVLHNATKRPENDRPAAGTDAVVSTFAELDAITN